MIKEEFRISNGAPIPLLKVVDFETLGALWGPRAPNPDLLCFVLRLSDEDAMEDVTLVRERSRVFTLERSMNSPNPDLYSVPRKVRFDDHNKKLKFLNSSIDLMHLRKLTRR